MEATLTAVGDTRHARDSTLGLGGRVDDPEVASPLGDEDAIVG